MEQVVGHPLQREKEKSRFRNRREKTRPAWEWPFPSNSCVGDAVPEEIEVGELFDAADGGAGEDGGRPG